MAAQLLEDEDDDDDDENCEPPKMNHQFGEYLEDKVSLSIYLFFFFYFIFIFTDQTKWSRSLNLANFFSLLIKVF